MKALISCDMFMLKISNCSTVVILKHWFQGKETSKEKQWVHRKMALPTAPAEQQFRFFLKQQQKSTKRNDQAWD